MPRQSEIIVGLDIGTSKVCALVGEINENGVLQNIRGFGSVPADGLRKGMVVNVSSTVESIHQVIEEAENSSGCKISDVYVGITGTHIRGDKSDGQVTLKNKEVCEDDIERVLDNAKALNMPDDRDIIHVLPQDYIIDGQDGIKEPLGMSGLKMKSNVYIVSCSRAAEQNIIRCCEKCGLNVQDVILGQLASSYAVLSKDEQELGVALVDIGSGTSDIAIWSNNSLVYTSVVDIAGSQITNDISQVLSTPLSAAEELKNQYGKAIAAMAGKDKLIDVPRIGGRAPEKKSEELLCQIIQDRVDDLFRHILPELEKSGSKIPSGLVLTGGTSLLPGIDEMAQNIIGLPATRIGYPNVADLGGLSNEVLNPIYSTSVGILRYAEKQIFSRQGKPGVSRSRGGGIFSQLIGLFKDFH